MYAEYGVPPEIEDGLTRLLASVAFPTGKIGPFTVITRDSALWFKNYPNEQITIYDISPLNPPMSRLSVRAPLVLQRLLNEAGWNESQVKPSKDYFQAGGGGIRPDFVLLDRGGKPIAITTMLDVSSFVGAPLQPAITQAETVGVRYAVLTNGRETVVFDRKSDLAIGRHTFPAPQELLPEAPVFDLEGAYKAVEIIFVTPIVGYPELAEVLTRTDGTLLLDHTLPWGQEAPEELKPYIPAGMRNSRRLDLLAALTAMATAAPRTKSVSAVLLPSILFNAGHKSFREFINKVARIEAVVELPGEVFRPSTTVRSSILKLSNGEAGPTFFFSITSRGDLIELPSQPWYSQFLHGLQGKPDSTGFHCKINPELPWTVASQRPSTADNERLLAYWHAVPLGFLCSVLPGCRHSREEVSKGRGLPVLRGRDISRGVRSTEDLGIFKFIKEPPEESRIREGDILVQRVGANPRSMVAARELEGTIASDTVIIFRPKWPDVDSYSIQEFLTSAPGQGVLASFVVGGLGAPALRLGLLHRMTIPRFDQSVVNELRGLATTEQSLLTKLEKVRSLRTDIFSASTAQEFQERLGSVSQLSRVISESFQNAESLTFQIRNYFPYPIAYAYRLLSGITMPSDLYREQLRVAENILAFVASVTLAILTKEDRARAGIDLRASWQGGISPGHWRDIIRKGAAALTEYKDNRLAQQIASLERDQSRNNVRTALDKLVMAKNDFKHDRGPKTDEEFQAGAVEVNNLIETCMRDLRFIVDFPIRLVRDMNVIRGTSVVTLTTLRCSGDHPGLAQEQAQYLTPLTRNDLYIEIDSGRWASLFPFIIPHDCEQCKAREFYFIDKWNGPAGPAIIKSFERGHVEQRPEIGEALQKI